MAELCRKEKQLKEMYTKKTSSPQQRSMVKRIKQKSRKRAYKPDFEYQPMTKAKETMQKQNDKEDTRNEKKAVINVPKPTESTNEEKEKENEKTKEKIETEKEPVIEPEPKEGADEGKEHRKENMKEEIGQKKEAAVEPKPKEDANQGKTQVQRVHDLESDDDFKEKSIYDKPLALSFRKTNKVWHSMSKKDQDQIQLINNTQSTACVWSGSEDENCIYFSEMKIVQ
ncbi:uncharacterized protein LOC114280187 [Camellia sinensis]|uniref:uncharacterized protein LOC114280187 n=1 Tax=Camellia sinensis TaxID=4442 RepID=UPI001036DCE6|nr:uncharacterized protein LOC114280187 [Camellia sinensis]